MEDFNQLNIQSPFEAEAPSVNQSPKSESDSASFEALLAEAGSEIETVSAETLDGAASLTASAETLDGAASLTASAETLDGAASLTASAETLDEAASLTASAETLDEAASLTASAETLDEAASLTASAETLDEAASLTASAETLDEAASLTTAASVFTATLIPSGEETPDLLPEELQSQGPDLGSVAVDELASELSSQAPDRSIAGLPVADGVLTDQPVVIEGSGQPVVGRADLPLPRPTEVALVETTVVETAEGIPEALALRSLETDRANNTAPVDRGPAAVSPTTGSPASPTIVSKGILNPFVPPGEGKSLKSLDLATFGVRAMKITAEAPTSSPTAEPQATVISPEAGSNTTPRPEPTLAMLGLRPVAAAAAGSLPTDPGPQPVAATAPKQSVPVIDTVDSVENFDNVNGGAATSQSSRPEVAIVSGAALKSQVTSQYVLNEGATGRRIGTDSKVVTTEATLKTAEKESTGSFVQMTSQIPSETGGSSPHTEPQPLAPRQPVKPVNLPTFSLDPVRRVTMMLGESGAGVRVQLTENQGEVSLRFDAPAAIRAGLELSVHNLVESLTRAQVPLSDVMFSGRFGTGTDSGQRHQDDGHGSGQGRSHTREAQEASFMTEFESSDADSLVSLTA